MPKLAWPIPPPDGGPCALTPLGANIAASGSLSSTAGAAAIIGPPGPPPIEGAPVPLLPNAL